MAVTDAPTSALGRLGTGGPFSTWAEDVLEHVPDLQWPLSVRTYAKMRTDPTLSSIIAAYTTPLLKAHWQVDPRGATPEITQVVADSLGLPIAGRDENPGPARQRGVRWVEHARLASLHLLYGHMAFEPVWEIRDGVAYLAALPERLPFTLTDIVVSDTGDLTGVKQTRPLAAKVDVLIPASRLLWYAHEREGSNWQGRSLLRAAFAPWLFKQDGWRTWSTTLRRFGAGTPVMEPITGTNPTPAQVAEAAKIAQAVRVGDTGGAATPGFTLRIKGVEGALPDHEPFMAYCDQQMARGTLTSLLDLGNTSNGSRALGNTFADVMANALQAIAEEVAVTATQIAVSCTDFNEGAGAAAPAVVVGDITEKPAAVATMIADLVSRGGLVMDDDLHAWVRDALGLPAPAKKNPPAPGPAPVPVQDPAAQDPPTVTAAYRRGGNITTGTGWPYARPLTSLEAAAGLDPRAIDDQTDALLGDLLQAWPALTAAQRDEIAVQVEDVLSGGDLTGLTGLQVDTAAAAAVLGPVLIAAFQAGTSTAQAEAARQGVTVSAPGPDADALTVRARAVAGILGQGLSATAAREALRLAGRDVIASDVAALVVAHLEGLSTAFVRDQLAAAVNTGLNEGRAAVFAAGPPTARFFHSAVRDTGTCEACAANDGHEYSTIEAAEADFPTGGYALCLGSARCRCIIFTRYDEAA